MAPHQGDDDSKPALAAPATNAKRRVIPFVLAAGFFERLAFFGLTGSLVAFFTKELSYDKGPASSMTSLFQTFTYVAPLVGGYLADARWGCYRTILGCFALYALGVALCAAAAAPGARAPGLFLAGLLACVALGAGGMSPLIVVLGANQYEDKPAAAADDDGDAGAIVVLADAGAADASGGQAADARDDDASAEEVAGKAKTAYFSAFYWCTSLGATVAFAALPTLATSGGPEGFFESFLVAAAALAASVGAIWGGRRRYARKAPAGSALADFCAVLVGAGRRCAQGRRLLASLALVALGFVVSVAGIFVPDDGGADAGAGPRTHMLHRTPPVVPVGARRAVAVAGLALLVLGLAGLVAFARGRAGWVAAHAPAALVARVGAARVADCARVVRLLPFASFLVGFWLSCMQMTTTVLLQGCQLDLRLGDPAGDAPAPQLGPASLQLVQTVAVIVGVPLANAYVFPAITRARAGGKGAPTTLERVGAGLACMALSSLTSGVVEVLRKRAGPIAPAVGSQCAPGGSGAAAAAATPLNNMSVWWQVPAFLFMGAGELLGSIAAMEFFYAEAPDSMRGVCQAINLLTSALGSLVAAALSSIFSAWLPTNLNDGHLDGLLFVVAGINAGVLACFAVVAPQFQYAADAEEEGDGEDEGTHEGGREVELTAPTVNVVAQI